MGTNFNKVKLAVSWFSTLRLQCKRSVENAYTRVKKLHSKILLRTMLWRTRKIIATALGVLVLVVLMWGMNPEIAAAQGVKGALGKIGDFTVAGGIFLLGAYFLRGLLTWLLGLASLLLDYAFFLNAYINPGQLALVQEGWVKLRDLANGLFILIILWIAITIIFNLEGLGGKKLLVRVIIVALLINFSLAMVSTVFAFGNALAKPFAKAMGAQVCDERINADGTATVTCPPPKNTVSQAIIANSEIHTVMNIFTDKGTFEAFQNAANALKSPKTTLNQPSPFESVASYMGASKPTHAAPPSAGTTAGATAGLASVCATAAWAGGATFYTGYGAAVAVAGAVCSIVAAWAVPAAIAWFWGNDIVDTVGKVVLDLVVTDLFLFLTMISMLTAAVILFLRIVAMAFLGVFAPIAFLGLAFPKYGDRVWSPWIDNLFRWTFVAPIFYFLLYLALLMLQTNHAAGVGTASGPVPLMANAFKIINLVMFLVFLWAAVYLTKKTAGHTAEVVLGLGRKAVGFGLGVGTGLAARGAGALALRGQKQIEKTFAGLGRIGIGIPVARRTQQYLARQRKRVEDREAQFAGGNEDFYRSQLGSAASAENITAIASAALKAGHGRALTGSEERIVNAAKKLGLQKQFLALAPHLTKQTDVSGARDDADAIERLLRGMSIDDKLKISDNALSPDVLNALWKTVNAQGLGRIGLENREMQGKMFEHLNSMDPTQLQQFRDTLTPARDQEFTQYFDGGLYNSTGVRWKPQHWVATRSSTGGAPSSPTLGSALTIASVAPPTGRVGTTYTFAPRATGGSGTYTNWRLGGGSPAGMTIDRNTGFISWPTPVAGTHTISVQVDDDTGAVSTPQRFTITINS